MRVFSICVLVYFLACPSVSLRSQNGGNREPALLPIGVLEYGRSGTEFGYRFEECPKNGALWLGDGCMAH